ncbi:MAG TPA: hypothetical protein EYP85_15765, partial [Armatimonadetes bacterium]|nr:hypothetical protein [Armatimonadota bacterium]
MPTSWDAIYKQVLVRWFERWGVTLVTEVEVARLPRRIDGVAICSPAERQRLAQTSPFDFFRQHNLLEFKSPNDPLTMREYQRVLGRAWFYAAEMEVKDPAEMSLCVVTSRKPVKVLTGSPAWVRFSRLRSGLYRSDDKIPVHLLVVPELPLREENYPLLLFARGRKRREFLRWLIGRKEVECLRWAYELYPQEVKEELIMSKDYPTLEENIRFIIQDIGLKRLLQETEPEELAEAVDLRALARAAGLRRILQEVQPEELA